MTTSYEEINQQVIKFNIELSKTRSADLIAFIEFNNKVLKLLKNLTQDKIGLELLNELKEKLKENSDSTQYVKQLHCLLIGDENNFVNQQARKKYELGAKAFYDIIAWMYYGTMIVLLTGIGVLVTLVLCLVIIPAPMHLILVGIAMVAGGCLNMLCDNIARPQALKLHNQLYYLKQHHTELLTDFDILFPNQQGITLTEEEKADLSGKSIKFYDYSNYYTRILHDGYHYQYSYLSKPSLDFSSAGKTEWLSIKDRQKFNTELNRIRQTYSGSSYELSSDEFKALITENTHQQHHPVLGVQCSSHRKKEDKPPFEAALRMKKLQFFHQELDKKIKPKDSVQPSVPHL